MPTEHSGRPLHPCEIHLSVPIDKIGQAFTGDYEQVKNQSAKVDRWFRIGR